MPSHEGIHLLLWEIWFEEITPRKLLTKLLLAVTKKAKSIMNFERSIGVVSYKFLCEKGKSCKLLI